MLDDSRTETHTIKSINFGKSVEYEIEILRVTENNNEPEMIGGSYDDGTWLWDNPESGFMADFEISNWLHDSLLEKSTDDSGEIIGEEVTAEEDLFSSVLDFLLSKDS